MSAPPGVSHARTAFAVSLRERDGDGMAYIEPDAMWRTLLADLASGTKRGVIAARFHRGLARALTTMALTLRDDVDPPRFTTVALSGGCFQNRILEEASRRLRLAGFEVLTHAIVPPNDGGIALGQVAIAAARLTQSSAPSKSSLAAAPSRA